MSRLYVISDRSEAALPPLPADGEPPEPPQAEAQAAFDERFGIGLFGRMYYINLRIGTELRSAERLAVEGQVRVSGVAFFYCFVCSAAIMLFGTICLMYLLKAGLGINLSSGNSILHPLYSMMTGS